MSKQSEVGTSDCRPTPALHRPFEDSDTPSQRQLQQRSALLRHQFPPGFVDVADPTTRVDRIADTSRLPGCLLQDPPIGSTLRQLTGERVFVPMQQQRCASSTAAEVELEADDDDDDTVDSATFNVSSNSNHTSNGLF